MDVAREVESTELDGFFRYSGAIDGSRAVIERARAKLVEAQVDLRDLWYDTVEQSPILAARLNSAARFAHLAADALATETLL